MRIIDTNTGKELRVGVPFTNVNGTKVITHVEEGLLSARVRYRNLGRSTHLPNRISEGWSPLHVRYTHPAFMFQKVGFFPS